MRFAACQRQNQNQNQTDLGVAPHLVFSISKGRCHTLIGCEGGNASSCSRSLIRSWSPHPCTQVIWIHSSRSRGIWTFRKKKDSKYHTIGLQHSCRLDPQLSVFSTFLVLKCNQTACVLHDWGPVRLLLVRCSTHVVFVNGYMPFEELLAIRRSLFCINFWDKTWFRRHTATFGERFYSAQTAMTSRFLFTTQKVV